MAGLEQAWRDVQHREKESMLSHSTLCRTLLELQAAVLMLFWYLFLATLIQSQDDGIPSHHAIFVLDPKMQTD